MTLLEVQLWSLLRRDGIGVRFRRQHPIGAFVLDFYAPSKKLAVEIDGAVHDHPTNAARDLMRDEWLSARGVRVLRVNAMDVLVPASRNDVLETIAAAIAARA